MRALLKNLLHLIGRGSADHINRGIDDFPTPPIVKAEFDNWCGPRRGQSNPENQTNPVWTWLIETAAWPAAAHRAAGNGPKQDPGWCFDRFGQSETKLDDGSSVFIGGEHEDF